MNSTTHTINYKKWWPHPSKGREENDQIVWTDLPCSDSIKQLNEQKKGNSKQTWWMRPIDQKIKPPQLLKTDYTDKQKQVMPPNLDKNTSEFPHQFSCCIAHLHSAVSNPKIFRTCKPPPPETVQRTRAKSPDFMFVSTKSRLENHLPLQYIDVFKTPDQPMKNNKQWQAFSSNWNWNWLNVASYVLAVSWQQQLGDWGLRICESRQRK